MRWLRVQSKPHKEKSRKKFRFYSRQKSSGPCGDFIKGRWRQVQDRWSGLTETITRGGRRKAGFEVKNLEGPSQRLVDSPRNL